MFQPDNIRAANPITLTVNDVRSLLWGGSPKNPIFVTWQTWLNQLSANLLPANLYEHDVSLPLPPHVRAGTQGWVWVSENFAALIQEVYAESLLRTYPSLPFTSFWATVEPYWRTPEWVTRRPMNVHVYCDCALNAQPRTDATTIILTFATVATFASESEIDYASTDLETAVHDMAALVKANGQKCVLAVGSWGSDSSAVFDALTASEDRMTTFAASCVQECQQFGFDGIDLNWEWPDTPEDQQRWVQLVTILAGQLHSAGLTLSAAARMLDDYGQFSAQVIAALDHVNIRMYSQVNPIASYDAVVDALVNIWLPKTSDLTKLHIGIPCFGWDFPVDGPVTQVPYRTILNTYGGEAAQLDSVGTVSYNGLPTVQAKIGLCSELGLGGVAFWEQSLDTSVETHSLIAAGYKASQAGVAEPGGLRMLMSNHNWTFVTGPSNWNHAKQVAVAIYPAGVAYGRGGRDFIDQALTLLG